MRVFCRLSWEEESNVSTGDDNSPAGKRGVFKHTKWQLIFARALTLYIRETDFCDCSNLLFSLGVNYASFVRSVESKYRRTNARVTG